jgi:Pentapeptide repeats (8 copies)
MKTALGATDEGKNKKLEIRLGGIYALERIAWDSLAMETSQGRAYSTVVEVLTAYVRENTTQTPGLHPLRRWLRSTAKPPAPPEPTADIQTILDVLSRTQAHAPEEYRSRLDLREAHLQGANLQQASLLKADLSEAHLQGAKLSGANLQEANLHGAIVTDEQLAATWSLQRATMPDGRKYEDWLKDKQGSGDDVENE